MENLWRAAMRRNQRLKMSRGDKGLLLEEYLLTLLGIRERVWKSRRPVGEGKIGANAAQVGEERNSLLRFRREIFRAGGFL